MTSDKPIILMVTGAWHRPFLYDRLKEQLNNLGYQFLCPELASMGDDKHGVTWHADVELICDLAEPLFDEGKEVVVIGHSYGGIPACAATQGLSVQERAAQGKRGGFRSVIFMAGFAIPKAGLDLLQTFGGSWTSWQNPAVSYTKNQLMTVNEKAKQAFFNDLPGDEAEKYLDLLVPHSQDAMETPIDFVATDLTIPKFFLVCEIDLALPLGFQEYLIQTIPGFRVERIHTGHSPFLSKPEECARLVVRMAEDVGS